MRGIVALAAAMALPSAFAYRDLIVLTAFSVVLGTLVIQGLPLKPLLRAFDLQDDDPVGREVRVAREHALGAALTSFADDPSPLAEMVRQQLTTYLAPASTAVPVDAMRARHSHLLRDALKAARETVLTMRLKGEIGDDAVHRIEEELDWLEMAGGRKGE
jgi:monovalent cation/hydrogen antiporter